MYDSMRVSDININEPGGSCCSQAMIGPIVNGPRVANDLVTNPVYLQLTTQTLAKYINILEKRFIHRSEMATNYIGTIFNF